MMAHLKRKNIESQEGAVSLSGAFTKVTKKKVKKKKSPLSDNLENHFLKDLSPAQRKLAEATDRKLQNNIDRHKAGPLFLMILPGEMEGSYIFVCRKKYGQLARNVLKGIIPFLIHHLCELTDTQADRVLGKWIPKSEIQATRRQLSIGMDMANAKDIDDGQTVTGMLDEMHEREQQLEEAFVEIEACDNALAAKDQALAQQKAATAALQAQLEALQRQTAHHLAFDSQPPAQNNKVSPDRSEFTTPPKKRKSKDTSTVKRGASTGLRLVLSRPLSQLAPARLFTFSSRSSGLRKSLRFTWTQLRWIYITESLIGIYATSRVSNCRCNTAVEARN
ncbi:unnamed protein product [Cylindrotheca closterium]|uniref:Uncharacterized protein n=1 Tax=Cylindrotheca closterium TaxID=2856 RepID=A0AAD2CKD9_9STRA|nr:unnamed protein product [Cylindrotheca closterium]